MESYLAVQSFATSYPGQVLYYMADDYANTNCSSIISWASANNMGDADAYFSNADINMSDYGTPGMPKIVVVGCTGHKVYYNENYTAAGIEDAINEALLECNTPSSINEKGGNYFNLSLYPNPSDKITTVSYKMKETSLVTIDVVNMTGETVLNISNSRQNKGISELQINTSSLTNGFYFLRVLTEKGSQTVKFSIEHQ